MLHLNKLPLRRIFSVLDGTTKSPYKFSEPTDFMRHGLATLWKQGELQADSILIISIFVQRHY